MRMRTIEEGYALLKREDPDTSFTKSAFRRLVVSGKIPSTRIGAKYLIDVDAFPMHLANMSQSSPLNVPAQGVRRLEV